MRSISRTTKNTHAICVHKHSPKISAFNNTLKYTKQQRKRHSNVLTKVAIMVTMSNIDLSYTFKVNISKKELITVIVANRSLKKVPLRHTKKAAKVQNQR